MALTGKQIVLGVTGSIAAYKAVELLRLLTTAGAAVRVVLTTAAQRFVTPLTFAALSRQEVMTDVATLDAESVIRHVALAEEADLLLIAPATAHTIAKCAHGLADDLLSTLFLAWTRPIVLAPAMDAGMYHHPTVQDNLSRLQHWGVYIVGPAAGELASGQWGLGRLADLDSIVQAVTEACDSNYDLRDEVVLITAGPTREPLDPVRYLSTRASGKMGYALAEEAVARGARTILISGPTALRPPPGVELLQIETALQMRTAALDRLAEATVVIKAAAVSDYRPALIAEAKLDKSTHPLSMELTPNPDILYEIGAKKGARIIVGFAAETGDLVPRAQRKLLAKQLDLIVANDVRQEGSGFGSETNQVILLDADGGVEALPMLPKRQVARHILDRIVAIRQQKKQVP